MSESDVYRRQILTYKDGHRAGRVNAWLLVDVQLMYNGKLISGSNIWHDLKHNRSTALWEGGGGVAAPK